MKRTLSAALVVAALAACGDEGATPTQRTESPSLAPTAEPTPPTATAPSAPPPPPDATGPEARPGGAGDEEAARTRVRLVLDAEGITPPRVEVPAFLALRITLRNDLPRGVSVVRPGGGHKVTVRARSTRSFDVGGLRRGEHRLAAGIAGHGTIVAR